MKTLWKGVEMKKRLSGLSDVIQSYTNKEKKQNESQTRERLFVEVANDHAKKDAPAEAEGSNNVVNEALADQLSKKHKITE